MLTFSASTRRALIALGTAAALGLGIAQAQSTDAPSDAPAATMAPTGAQLTIRDAYDRVEAAGYRGIREIEWEHDRYEVKASNAQGERVKLYVSGETGAVEQKQKHD